MHARAIFLVASLVLPIIAVPVPTSNISPIPTVERRSDFSVANIVRDLFERGRGIPDGSRSVIDKREPVVVTMPTSAAYDEADESKRSIGFPDGGSDKRHVKVAGGGPGKRDADAQDGDAEKRRVKAHAGGPGKRETDAEKRRVKAHAGGPGKRETDAEKRRVKNGGGGPSKRRVKTAPGGPSKRRVKTAPGGPSK